MGQSNLPLDYFKFQFHKGTIRTKVTTGMPYVNYSISIP